MKSLHGPCLEKLKYSEDNVNQFEIVLHILYKCKLNFLRKQIVFVSKLKALKSL